MFRLGSFYATYYPTFSLDQGDLATVSVNGAAKTVRVAYGTS